MLSINLIMQQTNTKSIKTFNKFYTCMQNLKAIQYLISNCCWQIPNHTYSIEIL